MVIYITISIIKRIIILGDGGYIGGCLKKRLHVEHPDVEILGFSSSEVDLTNKTVMRWESIPNVQTNQLEREFMAGKTLLQDEKWQAALAKRGYGDLEDVSCVPATPGYFGSEPERERRVGR